jgi:hypothetical protein
MVLWSRLGYAHSSALSELSMVDQYETRYCAFVDILGFRQLIDQVRNGSVPYGMVRQLLQYVHKPRQDSNVGIVNPKAFDFKAQSISDAVAISTGLSATGLALLFDSIIQLSIPLLEQGYFTRGAVCKGGLYHDDDMAFGDALVSAYKLESEVVRYPRIMIAKTVADDALSSNLSSYFKDHIRQADDGPFYLHVLNELTIIRAVSATEQQLQNATTRFENIAKIIQQQFDESVDNPRHFEKVQWYAPYWNNTFNASIAPNITGPGLAAAATWGQ